MDKLTPAERSENMRRIRSKNTAPEMLVRRITHGMGFRYRLHGKLPGRPDLIFPSKKKVIFVHGCFWHMHENVNCKISRVPKSNTAYWHEKLTKNKQRDKKNQAELEDMGWQCLIIWECQLGNEEKLKTVIKEFLA